MPQRPPLPPQRLPLLPEPLKRLVPQLHRLPLLLLLLLKKPSKLTDNKKPAMPKAMAGFLWQTIWLQYV
jgi:hypothetical protein